MEMTAELSPLQQLMLAMGITNPEEAQHVAAAGNLDRAFGVTTSQPTGPGGAVVTSVPMIDRPMPDMRRWYETPDRDPYAVAVPLPFGMGTYSRGVRQPVVDQAGQGGGLPRR